MALQELTNREILQAVAEYDRLGRDAFLRKYGFGEARTYLLVVNGKTYDSKAIVGAAHGFLPDQEHFSADQFSGGAATVGRLLRGLGFEVTDGTASLTVSELIEQLSSLRPYRSPAGRRAHYQPLTLLWAIGRAHQGMARMTRWRETEKELGGFLSRHGEPPRPQYPVTALYHRHLWDFDGLERVPPAHRDAPFVSLARTQPLSGLPAAVYNLIRYSGEARVAAVATLMDKYLEGADCDAVLLDAGLADAEIADDEDPSDIAVGLAVSPLEEEYRRLCEIADRGSAGGSGQRRSRVLSEVVRLRSARRAVLKRSEGHCENPLCEGEARDFTDAGDPILEVDHIYDLARGGPDHPEQMIALCPNCHAIKTRGRTRERLRQELFAIAKQRHESMLARCEVVR